MLTVHALRSDILPIFGDKCIMINTRLLSGIDGSKIGREIRDIISNVAFLSQSEARSLHDNIEEMLAVGCMIWMSKVVLCFRELGSRSFTKVIRCS